LKRASREVGTQVLAIPCDVRDPLSIQQLCAAIEGRFHRIDILINNAGIAHPMRNVDKLDLSTWSEVLETNLTGMFLVTHHALPLMSAGGTIVNNLSIAAKRVFTGQSAYIASKHGALGFTNALREELRPRQIRVISLLPGATNTGLWEDLWPDAPRRKMISPQTVAEVLTSALKAPPESTVEELLILPTAGTL
jgi:NAD(P)-dependent dehydrogenase (short-subunit alcohol dehydrogenase family)